MISDPDQDIALVVIGRNEGARLKSCLHSIVGRAGTIVYVDSGSIDGSPQYAASVGCRVMELDPSRPFTAARARNEGFASVMKLAPDVPFVQFLDGDCDLSAGWLEQGIAVLTQREDIGIVCGNVRELYPGASIYNRLCNLEWQQSPGEVKSSGGRFMVRAEIFRAVGGFRTDVIAAEDDEFCIRVRAEGHKILQLNVEMARHDAAIMHFSEWVRRSRRTGHAYAQVSALHGHGEEQYFVRDCRRIWLWGFLLPVAAICFAPITRCVSLLVALCAYTLQFARIYLYGRRRGWNSGDALVYAWFTVLFKFPALFGLLEYHWRRWHGDALTIIEYKGSASSK